MAYSTNKQGTFKPKIFSFFLATSKLFLLQPNQNSPPSLELLAVARTLRRERSFDFNTGYSNILKLTKFPGRLLAPLGPCLSSAHRRETFEEQPV